MAAEFESFLLLSEHKMDLDQHPWVHYIQLHRFIPSQSEDLAKIHCGNRNLTKGKDFNGFTWSLI